MPTKKKIEEKPVKKVKTAAPKKAEVAADLAVQPKKAGKLIAEVFDLEGKVIEKISLPEEIFGVKINKKLIAQAVRVLRANQRQGNASTKTRGEVEGSTRKIYRQKGTGRARHGSIRAPIFVHGGIVGGPKPRDYGLQIPQKMKRAAMFGALSAKLNAGELKVVGGFEKIEPKTKKFISAIDKLGLAEKKIKILVVTGEDFKNLKRASGNVEGVTLNHVKRLNAYDILNNRKLLFMKEAIAELSAHFLKKGEKASKKA